MKFQPNVFNNSSHQNTVAAEETVLAHSATTEMQQLVLGKVAGRQTLLCPECILVASLVPSFCVQCRSCSCRTIRRSFNPASDGTYRKGVPNIALIHNLVSLGLGLSVSTQVSKRSSHHCKLILWRGSPRGWVRNSSTILYGLEEVARVFQFLLSNWIL